MTTTRTATRDMARPGADSNAKRAAKVADLIIEDVMALGWPVGQVLGSETDLLERYQVSRAVFREAVRLVEHQQVARTRRGPGGGLVVTEPTVGAVIDAVVLYLHRVDARLDEIFEARIILEDLACQLASERTDENDLAELRHFAESKPIEPGSDPRGLHALVAAISRNAGLELFVDVFNRVAQLYSPDWQRLGATIEKETRHAHAMIAEALMAGDAGLARNRMRKHLQAEADFFRRRRSTRQLLPDSVVLAQSAQGKGAETVARNITQTIVTEGLQPGQMVGTEPELIEREGVSRALLREAVRLLEHHQIARMRRGPGGGLFVMAPSTNAVTEVAAIYLARRGMQLAELAEMRTGVEVAITDLAAERIDDERRRRTGGGADPGGARHRRGAGRGGARPACSRCGCGQEPGASARRPGAHPPEPTAPDRAPRPEGTQADHRRGAPDPRGHRPRRSSPATASWPGTACAGTSRRSAPSCTDRRRSPRPLRPGT